MSRKTACLTAIVFIFIITQYTQAQQLDYYIYNSDEGTTQTRMTSDPSFSEFETIKVGDRIHFRDCIITLENIRIEEGDIGFVDIFAQANTIDRHFKNLKQQSDVSVREIDGDVWIIRVRNVSPIRGASFRILHQTPRAKVAEQPLEYKPPTNSTSRKPLVTGGGTTGGRSSSGISGGKSVTQTLRRGGILRFETIAIRLVDIRLDRARVRGRDEYRVDLVVNTPTSSQRIGLQQYRAQFVEDYRIYVGKVTSSRPGQGRAQIEVERQTQ